MATGNGIRRFFTKNLKDGAEVAELFSWKSVNVLIKNHQTGEPIADMRDLQFPERYSQSACDIIASKYFRKKGVPNALGMEVSMQAVAHRMADFWADALVEEGVLDAGERQIFYDEIMYMLLDQIFAPNSPQWFNTGHAKSYGITGDSQGHYYFDEAAGQVELSKDTYTRTQGSACFIIAVRDSLLGEKSLTDQLRSETMLFKYGSGVGTNWSTVRARNEFLSSGGKSSGLLSFLKVSDRNAGAIKSGGTTRRAAKMNILNLDHPEILDYIRWKAREEDKAVALGKMGYSTGLEGEAYETVSGQNANNSVRIPDSFMDGLEDPDSAWQVTGRVDPSLDRLIPTRELWEEIGKAAWRCGDPGVQFDDTINAWHTCPAGEDGEVWAPHNRINASNPCSEYMFLDDTACNLASINVMRFYDEETGTFDTEGFCHAVSLVMLVLEATIHWGQFPTKDIARKSYLFRTTGIGLANVAALLMAMGLPYDSEEARTVAAALCSVMTGQAYDTSAAMAERLGEPFPAYGRNAAYMKRVLRNHARAAGYDERDTEYEGLHYEPVAIDHGTLRALGLDELSARVRRVWKNALDHAERCGLRNAQVSVLAPTGTIAFAMDCATTSTEPFYSHVVYKKLVGGAYMQIVNPVLPTALRRLGYTEQEIEEIVAYVMRTEERDGCSRILDGKIEGAPHLRPEHYAVFDTAAKCGTGERYISPEGHVRMMAALSPHISGAISKTVNLPSEATVQDVLDIYALSWKLGVKAIALYRDGCKVCQPLQASRESGGQKPLEDCTYAELLAMVKNPHLLRPLREKPTGIRKAKVHETEINGLKLYITTSFYDDGRLGELYISSGREGSLTKGLLDSISKMISEMLQYGVPARDIAKMYRGQKFEPSGFVKGHPYIKSVDSISDLISKIIDIELGDYTFCQVKPDAAALAAAENPVVHAPAAGSAEPAPAGRAGQNTYSAADYLFGETCPNCKSDRMVRNGTCKVCADCGTTTGCS